MNVLFVFQLLHDATDDVNLNPGLETDRTDRMGDFSRHLLHPSWSPWSGV